MKITAIETYLVNPGHRNYIFVRVLTDEGLYGVGEAYSAGPDDAVVAVIKDFETWLVGRDPREIEAIWSLLYNASRFPGGVVTNAAISGIEHALWDIKGKALGVPVYELLGGKQRDRHQGQRVRDEVFRFRGHGTTCNRMCRHPACARSLQAGIAPWP